MDGRRVGSLCVQASAVGLDGQRRDAGSAGASARRDSQPAAMPTMESNTGMGAHKAEADRQLVRQLEAERKAAAAAEEARRKAEEEAASKVRDVPARASQVAMSEDTRTVLSITTSNGITTVS